MGCARARAVVSGTRTRQEWRSEAAARGGVSLAGVFHVDMCWRRLGSLLLPLATCDAALDGRASSARAGVGGSLVASEQAGSKGDAMEGAASQKCHLICHAP